VVFDAMARAHSNRFGPGPTRSANLHDRRQAAGELRPTSAGGNRVMTTAMPACIDGAKWK
jgi:hypothetical protein